MAPGSWMRGKRDLRLDFLRGYALVAMTLTHLGLNSPLIFVTGGSRFLINAAEVFFFISGYAIGYIASSRELGQQVQSRLKRAWDIFKYILFFTILLTLLFDGEEFFRIPHGETSEWLISLLYMREAAWGMDILVAYVLFVGLSPLALWALYSGRLGALSLAIAGVYLTALASPDAARLPFAAFRSLPANVAVFFVPLILGFKHAEISAWWRGRSWRGAADALTVLAGCLLLAVFLVFHETHWWQAVFGSFAVREFVMPPQNLLLVFLYLRLLWLVVTHLWPLVQQGMGWLCMPLGQDSLFVFCMHMAWIEVFHVFLDPILPWHDVWILQMLGEATVIALLLGGVLARRGVLVVLGRRGGLEWAQRHLLNLLIWVVLAWLAALAMLAGEAGGWWWQDPYFLREFL